MPESGTIVPIEKRKINCDQVSVVMGILERLQNIPKFSRFARMPEAAQLAALLEVMEILGYEFEDNAAAGNALSRFSEFDELRGIGE
jgi:hypothetical protein